MVMPVRAVRVAGRRFPGIYRTGTRLGSGAIRYAFLFVVYDLKVYIDGDRPFSFPEVSAIRTYTSKKPAAKAVAPPAPLRTYNVTKADAKPILATHHSLTFDGQHVNIPWDEGLTSRFHNFWLRDHCACPSCRHPKTRQRIVNTWTIPVHVRAKSVDVVPAKEFAELLEGKEANSGEEGIRITWDDGHVSVFGLGWLHLHSYNPRLEKYFSPKFELWGRDDIEKERPTVQYDKIMAKGEEGVAEWTGKIYRHGICFVEGVPPTPEATEELLKRMAVIRHTHYGGFWDFTSNFEHGDLAYSQEYLPAHTDTTYFTDPCGLQFFHCLEHDGNGGRSLFVDGFRAAQILRKDYPDEYKLLSRITISAHASGDEDNSIRPATPMPVLVHDNITGELLQVRWNNEDRATMDRVKGDEVMEWYKAARVWDEILRRDENEYWTKLAPGTVVGFDNWRVLHGRDAFDGKRRMCGAYSMFRSSQSTISGCANTRAVSRDDFYSRYLVTNAGRKAVLRAI